MSMVSRPFHSAGKKLRRMVWAQIDSVARSTTSIGCPPSRQAPRRARASPRRRRASAPSPASTNAFRSDSSEPRARATAGPLRPALIASNAAGGPAAGRAHARRAASTTSPATTWVTPPRARAPRASTNSPARSAGSSEVARIAYRTISSGAGSGPPPSPGRPAGPAAAWSGIPGRGQPTLEPGQPLRQVRVGGGVGEPEEAARARAERLPGGDDHAVIEQEPRGEGPRVAGDGADVGERVEGAVRARAADAGHPVQPRDDQVAAAPVGLPHRLHRVLGAAQRRQRGPLGRGVHAGRHLL